MAGLLYIHSHGILHCDLKLSNILLDEFGILKLRGLGHSKFIPFSQSTHPNPAQQQHRLQHMQYAAPELYRPDHGVFSFASDIWSLGCVLVELATGKVFSENAPAPLAVADRKRVADGLRKALDAGNLSHEFRDLALGMLDEDPYKRMQWPELLSHPFWQGCRRPELPVLPTQPAFEALRDIIPPPPPLGGVDEDNQYEDDFESDVSMSSGASNASDVTGDTGSTGLRFTPPSSLDWGGAEGRSKLKRATSNPTFPQQSDGGEGSAGEGPALTLSPPAPDPESLLMHSSDSLVTPIIGNKAIEGAASTPK
jgi:serine/threonine protein kinase